MHLRFIHTTGRVDGSFLFIAEYSFFILSFEKDIWAVSSFCAIMNSAVINNQVQVLGANIRVNFEIAGVNMISIYLTL